MQMKPNNVTDTFHLVIVTQQIRTVSNSSNDPLQYYQARECVYLNRPELIEIPCEGIWEDGTTPCECVQAMVKGYIESSFVHVPASNKSDPYSFSYWFIESIDEDSFVRLAPAIKYFSVQIDIPSRLPVY